MLTEAEARQFAERWLLAWNSHDLDGIMSHYGSDVILTSPAAATLLNEISGTIVGKEALKAYFKLGLAAYPSLTFELLDVMYGISSVVLYYVNQKGTKTAEYMEFDAQQQVVRVVANYGG